MWVNGVRGWCNCREREGLCRREGMGVALSQGLCVLEARTCIVSISLDKQFLKEVQECVRDGFREMRGYGGPTGGVLLLLEFRWLL